MRLLLSVTLVLMTHCALGQNKSVYKSADDELLTVRTVSILPVFDNLRGIYSRPIENHIIEKIKKSHRWEFAEANTAGPILTPDELSENPEAVKNVAQGLAADAFVATSIIKGPSGIALKMSLYLKADQKLLAQEEQNEIKRFDVEALKKTSSETLDKLLKKLPYSGMILSRQSNRVTVNLGRQDGVTPEQVVSIIQIIKVTRHPKFGFLISTEKEIIGKVKLIKVDDTLSFGRIVTEKESGSIQVNAKIASLDEVTYTNTDSYSENKEGVDTLATRPDSQITYGKSPIAWLPTKKPTFGMVGARLGLGRFTENVKTTSALDAEAPYYPSIAVEGELWLTPVWSMHAMIKQGIITTDNPVSGGSPAELSHALSSYDFLMGYNMRLGHSANAPKVEGLFGYSSYRLFVDESNPVGLTTKRYSGMKLGLSGSYPISGDSPYSVGANLFFMFQARLSESPGSSGSADNSINTFGFFVDKALTINLKARGALDFELYSSDFTGGSASSSSQKPTVASAGLYYMF